MPKFPANNLETQNGRESFKKEQESKADSTQSRKMGEETKLLHEFNANINIKKVGTEMINLTQRTPPYLQGGCYIFNGPNIRQKPDGNVVENELEYINE